MSSQEAIDGSRKCAKLINQFAEGILDEFVSGRRAAGSDDIVVFLLDRNDLCADAMKKAVVPDMVDSDFTTLSCLRTEAIEFLNNMTSDMDLEGIGSTHKVAGDRLKEKIPAEQFWVVCLAHETIQKARMLKPPPPQEPYGTGKSNLGGYFSLN